MAKSKGKAKPLKLGRDREMHLASVEIENPDWEPAKDGVAGVPRFNTQQKNIRESAIETLHARKFLAASQKLAADRFHDLYRAAGGTIASLDYSRDRVDGGKSDMLAAKVVAARELKRCRILLGRRGYENVEAVCGEGKALTDLSPHKRERLTMADNLRADLDDLASMWGMQTRQRGSDLQEK